MIKLQTLYIGSKCCSLHITRKRTLNHLCTSRLQACKSPSSSDINASLVNWATNFLGNSKRFLSKGISLSEVQGIQLLVEEHNHRCTFHLKFTLPVLSPTRSINSLGMNERKCNNVSSCTHLVHIMEDAVSRILSQAE